MIENGPKHCPYTSVNVRKRSNVSVHNRMYASVFYALVLHIGVFWGIFKRTDLKIKFILAVFRVDFDGDIHFCVAPPKWTFLLIFKTNVFVDFHSFFVIFWVCK